MLCSASAALCCILAGIVPAPAACKMLALKKYSKFKKQMRLHKLF
jgi:hypothetical protein